MTQVLRFFRPEEKAQPHSQLRGRRSRWPKVAALVCSFAVLIAWWRRGGWDVTVDSAAGELQVNQSSPSCRAAALGPSPSKEELEECGRPLPGYMVKAVDGDEGLALRRWAETLQWRCEIGDDTMLSRPHPNLGKIAPNYPQFLHLPDREGRITYWELIGHINIDALVKAGLTGEDIIRHYIWSTLFTWDVAAKDDNQEVTIIIDMAGFTISTLTPTVLSIFYRVAKLLRKHFPGREAGMYFVNAPSWSEQASNMVAPLVSQKQREKVRVYREEHTPALLASLVPPPNLPREYGGKGPPLGKSPLERRKQRLAATGSL